MPKLGERKRVRLLGSSHEYIWIACEKCGKERWVQLVGDKPRKALCVSCSKTTKGWTLNVQGYPLTKLMTNDFYYPMARKKGYVLDHRLIMAKHLNRCLLPWEVVHHKNGIRDDNRLENLELLPEKRFHLVDLATKSRLAFLEKRVTILEAENARMGKLIEDFHKVAVI